MLGAQLVGRNRWGSEVSVPAPEEPGLWLTLTLIALVSFGIGLACSGIRWRQLTINPWLLARESVSNAAAHSKMRFWVVWTVFCVAIVLVIAAAFDALYWLVRG